MLKELFGTISGAAANTAFSQPAGNGINIPAQATFKKFFNNVMSSFNNPLNGANGQFPGIQGQGQFPGIQGQNQFSQGRAYGGFPTQGQYNFLQQNSPQRDLRNQAFAPGSVLVNSQEVTQNPVQQGFQPLQGFAGQAGIQNNGVNGISGAQFPPIGGFPMNNGGGGGFGGKLPMLIMPFISLFGLVKNFFGLRRMTQQGQPEIVDKNATQYNSYNNYIAEEYEEGSFEEPGAYEVEKSSGNNFDYSKLQEF